MRSLDLFYNKIFGDGLKYISAKEFRFKLHYNNKEILKAVQKDLIDNGYIKFQRKRGLVSINPLRSFKYKMK